MVSSFHWKLRGTAHSPLFFVFFPIVKGIATSIVLDSLTKEASFPWYLDGGKTPHFFCTFLIVVSIKYFYPNLRKQFASKFLRLCSIPDISGLLDMIPLFRDDFYRDCFLTLRRRWVRVTEARDWSDQLNCQYRVGAITTNSATE